SHIRMFDFFGGVPARILIDNLKSGVIKPDLYDPKLNRVYREMAEHYGCFIDPYRVRHPKDKGKVERDVQTVRQQFRKFVALKPAIDIVQTNRQILKWIVDEYGQRDHGTTRLKPFQTFIDKEQPALSNAARTSFSLDRAEPGKRISPKRSAIRHAEKVDLLVIDDFAYKKFDAKSFVSNHHKRRILSQKFIAQISKRLNLNLSFFTLTLCN
ncbi:MAG: DDE-type integrase/transposase/recombinase, partial [Actinobacteria bacterium]|nr:DDE-type integrase/transposase/recombinase [Actinomycetota bacterium]